MAMTQKALKLATAVALSGTLAACSTTATDDYNMCALGAGVVGLTAGVLTGGTGSAVIGAAGGGGLGYLLCDEDIPMPVEPVVAAAAPMSEPAPEAAAESAPAPVAAPVGDEDGDGVNDDTDRCPGTAPGTVVDAFGCAVPISFSMESLGFAFDSAMLPSNADTILGGAVQAIESNANARFEIAGHTDSTGPEIYNQGLSERRANAVSDYLIGRGVASDRLDVMGYGESSPVADNGTFEGRAANRRVEIRVVD